MFVRVPEDPQIFEARRKVGGSQRKPMRVRCLVQRQGVQPREGCKRHFGVALGCEHGQAVEDGQLCR